MLIYWPYATLQTLVSKCFCILEQNITFTLSLPFPVQAERPQVWGVCFVLGFLGGICFCWVIQGRGGLFDLVLFCLFWVLSFKHY